MENETKRIAERIREIRVASDLKQSELEKRAKIPDYTVSKIETGKRESSGTELIRIAKSLGMTVDMLVSNEDSFVYQEEIKVIEALRELPFEDYKRVLGNLEALIYFLAKDANGEAKTHLENLVTTLISLRQVDRRPRSKFMRKQRVRSNEKRIG